MQDIKTLSKQFNQVGRLRWIGLRPARGEATVSVTSVIADEQSGLQGDRYNGRSKKRQVTLIQYEHIQVLEVLTAQSVKPDILRRNLVIANLNLLALKNHTFTIGDVVLQMTGLCQPCSKMETVLGHGAYNAMRGHGGITAQIIRGGTMRVGDTLSVLDNA